MVSRLLDEIGNLAVIGRSPVTERHPGDQSDRHRWTWLDLVKDWSVPMPWEELKPKIDEVECHDPQPPKWLGELATLAKQAFHSQSQLAPVGCHFHRNDEAETPQWEVTLFVSSTEVCGGARDGQCVFSRFMVDLRELMAAFDVVESCYWQAQTMTDDDQLGPHVGGEGRFQGHSVWLRITAQPPSKFEPGRVYDQASNELQNRW